MANVPIVTEVTKAELDALVAANGLNEGLQYKVTDFGWLLLALSANTLYSVGDTLILLHEQIKPAYIDCKTVLIKTPLIVDDTQFTIPYSPVDFFVVRAYLKSLNVGAMTLDIANSGTIIHIAGLPGDSYPIVLPVTEYIKINEEEPELMIQSTGNISGYYCMVECSKLFVF